MLIDDILSSSPEDIGAEDWPDLILLEKAYVIRVQNIHDYIYGPGAEKRDLSFPNVAPTMPTMWFEWVIKAPIVHLQTNGIREGLVREGVLVLATDILDTQSTEAALARSCFIEYGLDLGKETRWCVRGYKFHKVISPGKEPWRIGSLDWRVGPQGELLHSHPDGGNMCWTHPVYSKDALNKFIYPGLQRAMATVWTSLSFMHCKNINIEKSAPIPSKLQKSRLLKGKHSLLRHHTIIVSPTSSIKPIKGESKEETESRALHICRGHFKKFDEHALFGKHKGTYWWPMHSRGSMEHGKIMKDYAVLSTDKKQP